MFVALDPDIAQELVKMVENPFKHTYDGDVLDHIYKQIKISLEGQYSRCECRDHEWDIYELMNDDELTEELMHFEAWYCGACSRELGNTL